MAKQINELEYEFYEKSLSGEIGTSTSVITVNQDNVQETLGGTIDSSRLYKIEGVVDVSSVEVTVPIGGISLAGNGFNVSGLVSLSPNHTIFKSEVGGCGDILGQDYFIICQGAGSKVYDLENSDGLGAFEIARVNYINCVSSGVLKGFRQGLETGTGRFGGTPTLTLDGSWIGGYLISTSVAGNLDAGMNVPLFKAGATFLMNSRFKCNMNINLPPLASFSDFSPINFLNPNTMLLQGMRVTREGVIDADGTNINTGLNETDTVCNWKDNVGIPNTYKGGRLNLDTEVLTPITSTVTSFPLLGTYSADNLVHFSQVSNGRLKFLSDSTREYRLTYDYVIESNSNNDLTLLVKVDKAGGGTEIVAQQTRTVNNLTGGRDVAFFNSSAPVNLKTGDEVYVEIVNLNGNDVTAEIDSFYWLEER